MNFVSQLWRLKEFYVQEMSSHIYDKNWKYGLPYEPWLHYAVEYAVWLWIQRDTTRRIEDEAVLKVCETIWATLYEHHKQPAEEDRFIRDHVYRLIERSELHGLGDFDGVNVSSLSDGTQRRLAQIAGKSQNPVDRSYLAGHIKQKLIQMAEAAAAEEAKKAEQAKRAAERAALRKAKKANSSQSEYKDEPFSLEQLIKMTELLEASIQPPDLTEIVVRAKLSGLVSHDALPVYEKEKDKVATVAEALLPHLRRVLALAEEVADERGE